MYQSLNKCLSCVYATCRYTPEQQEALVSNVFLTGGNMQYPGMKERVERELLAMRPFQSHFKVQGPICCLKPTLLIISIDSTLLNKEPNQNTEHKLSIPK